ncbi:hypothetical protein GGI21_004407, partial [Coemansia aciculifera]
MELTVLYAKKKEPSRQVQYIIKYRYNTTTTFADVVEYIISATGLDSPIAKLVHPQCTRDIRPTELVYSWGLGKFGSILFLRISDDDGRFLSYH